VNDESESVPGKPWTWRTRLALYLLLQAAIVGVCILVLNLPLPEPPQQYRLAEATLSDGGTQAVALPSYLPAEFSLDVPHVFTLSFDRPAAEKDEVWSVFVPRFVSGVEIAVNGSSIMDSRRDPTANRADRNTPKIAPIPAVLLHDGANTLTVGLYAWGPLNGYLGRVYAGPDDALRPAYERRVLIFLTLPVVFSAWQAILAVLIGVMWLMRRHEPAYGVFAAAMALGAVQAFVSPAVGQHSLSAGLNAVLLASSPLEAACVLIFFLAFFGLKCPRYVWVVFVPGILTALLGLLGGPASMRDFFLLLGPPTVLAVLVVIAVVLARVAVTRKDGIAMLLGSAITIVIASAAHDMLLAYDLVRAPPIVVSRLSYSGVLVAIGIGLTWRFARALNEVDGFAARMVGLVRDAEDRLRASMALEEERSRAAALATERNRLMRDLHDGLGGQLVSIVALSERRDWEGDRIGEAARAALRDLRLVIDAMDDIDGDLMLALATWRERTAAQLRPHGLPLEWRVLTPQGMPRHPELRPWHVIQILRLLDEAVTNAVKHAGASRIAVSIETAGDGAESLHGRITIEDDGCGFPCDHAELRIGAPKAGRGLANMRRRAARCGARLELTSGPGGTRVRLDLPREFPAAELAAG
jgi:signal transduction histidine kinase